MRNLRKAQAILRLAEKHSGEIESVSERALWYGNTRYKEYQDDTGKDHSPHPGAPYWHRFLIWDKRSYGSPLTSAGRCAMTDHHLMGQLRTLKLGGFAENP